MARETKHFFYGPPSLKLFIIFKNTAESPVWWYNTFNSALRRQRQVDLFKFKASLGYRNKFPDTLGLC